MCLLRSSLDERKKAQCDNFQPMVNKLFASPQAALADIPDGATIMIGGFGNAGMPAQLIDALIAQGARDLTIVNNNAGNGDHGLAAIFVAGIVVDEDRKSTRLNSSHVATAYAVFCLKKKKR